MAQTATQKRAAAAKKAADAKDEAHNNQAQAPVILPNTLDELADLIATSVSAGVKEAMSGFAAASAAVEWEEIMVWTTQTINSPQMREVEMQKIKERLSGWKLWKSELVHQSTDGLQFMFVFVK